MNQKLPLYYKIMESIREDILNGIYPLGSMIPTENELEKQFDVSKITIRKAIELLEHDGYVKKKSGHGTTVISNSLYNKLSKGESFSNILRRNDCVLKKEHQKMKRVKLNKEAVAYPYYKTSAIAIDRTYFLDEQPYIYMQHFLPSEMRLATDIDDLNFSIYMFLYKNKYLIHRFEDFFFTTTADTVVAEALSIAEGTALLGRKRITFDTKDKVIEVSMAYYNTDLHPYQINYFV